MLTVENVEKYEDYTNVCAINFGYRSGDDTYTDENMLYYNYDTLEFINIDESFSSNVYKLLTEAGVFNI